MNAWIDFKVLRKKLDFEQVLRHYDVEVKRKGSQHQGFCPLPDHQGKKNSPSFSANLERGIFQCFGCGAKGNVLEFAAMMEKVDPKDGAALHKVAGELQKRFCPELGASQEAKPPATKPEKTEPKSDLPVVVNAPLDFELKGLDRKHPYLLNRGFSQETIDHFGLLAGWWMTPQSAKTTRDTVSLANASVTANTLNSERRYSCITAFGSKRRLTI